MTDLGAAWTVLETEAGHGDQAVVRTVAAGLDVAAGEVRLGVDGLGRRHLLIPLLPGEGVAEDRGGRGVHVVRITLDGVATVSIVCTSPALNDIFERLAREILAEIVDAPSPANRAIDVLNRWKELLAAALTPNVLNDEQLIGLVAELLCAREIVSRDPERRLHTWTGPEGHQHDFFCDDIGVEVKASSAREGRLVAISSIDQLDKAPGTKLLLAFHRFQPAGASQGFSLIDVMRDLKTLGVDASELDRKMTRVGYGVEHADYYSSKRFVLEETRVYDVLAPNFPRITRQSFVGGDVPPGTLRLRYAIDLTNEPPAPLVSSDVDALWEACAR